MAEGPGGRGPEPAPGAGPPLIGVALTLAGIALLVLLIALIEPLRIGIGNAVQGDTESLRTEIRDLHFGGVLIVFALALAHAVIWYPAEILDAAAGFVYGFWVAMPLIMAGWLLNAVVAYWIGRHAARPVLYRFVREDRFHRLERIAEEGGVALLLGMRLIPIIPFSLFSIVAGAAHVAMPRFLWTTAVGYIPITALFVYLGSQLEELSPTDPILWIGAIVMIALLLLTRRLRRMVAGSEPAGGRGEEAQP
ncbi:MAG: TVP38/TMEM64 family protein [Solirubrobacterales bacterium]